MLAARRELRDVADGVGGRRLDGAIYIYICVYICIERDIDIYIYIYIEREI